jgi:7,8-dihydro-6-hydroxymethylpterin-pyrophosphokinase
MSKLKNFIKENKIEVIKQLNQREEKNEDAKTIDFDIIYTEGNKVYAERKYLPFREENKKRTSLDEISFSKTKGRYEITVNEQTLKYSIYNI